jgi:hypothetical protein
MTGDTLSPQDAVNRSQTPLSNTPTRPSSAHSAAEEGNHGGSAAPSVRPPSAIYAPTQVVYSDPEFSHPPDLNYTLRTRIKWIVFFWTLVVLDCVCMPIALYFGLWYGTNLSHNAGTL